MLAELDMDSASIMTGLLHDTVEDTGATLDDLRELFGDEVALLVDGVTKLDKLELRQVLAYVEEHAFAERLFGLGVVACTHGSLECAGSAVQLLHHAARIDASHVQKRHLRSR